MQEPLYDLDQEALRAAVQKRGLPVATVSKLAHVDIRTLRRMLGEETPRNMNRDRCGKVRGLTAIKVGYALRSPPQVFCPDLPQKPPEEKPPKDRSRPRLRTA